MSANNKQQVMALIQSGRWPEAKKACVQLCAAGGDAEAWFMRAGVHAQLGEMEDVVASCRKVLELAPDNLAALYNLGVALQWLKRHDEAVQTYQELLKRDNRHALAHANLGVALRELGRAAEAETACRASLQLKPDMVEAMNTLGLLCKDQGNFDEAMVLFQEALRLRPGYADACYNLGICHEAQGRVDDAATAYKAAAVAKANYAEPLVRLGAIASQQKRPEEAVDYFRRAIAAKPDSVEALDGLATTLLEQDNFSAYFEEAEQCYREALRHQPENKEIRLNFAVMLLDATKHEEALTEYRCVAERYPDCVEAQAGIAKLLEFKGALEEGAAMVTTLLERHRGDKHVALAYGALARHMDKREDAIAVLEDCLLDSAISNNLQIKAHFLLGKLYDELKDYERAVTHYSQANKLSNYKFDSEANHKFFDEVIGVFSREGVVRRPRASNRSRLPVFIVGMPRSGTSLVEQILASHPQVHGAGELRDIGQIAGSLPEIIGSPVPCPMCVEGLNRKTLDLVAQRHLNRLGKFAREATRVTDKMPHNFLNLGLIDMLFPEARIIHCQREPLDTCLSIYFNHFNPNHAYAADLAHLGIYYREYLRIMDHWKSVLRVPILEVRYEDMVADQEGMSRKMLEFIGLEWDERCLRFYESERKTKTISYDQVRRPIYKKSVARWMRYDPYIEPLKTALGQEAAEERVILSGGMP